MTPASGIRPDVYKQTRSCSLLSSGNTDFNVQISAVNTLSLFKEVVKI